MPNVTNKAYALTLLCPIKDTVAAGQSGVVLTRDVLEGLGVNECSPLAKVPNTYLARFYILDDVFYQGAPEVNEHLKSKYLGFSSNFYGDLDEYLAGFWENAESEAREIWQYCYGFESVNDEASFIAYIKKCQLETTFYFNGSVDDDDDVPLDEQLKALYLKQEFSKFAWSHQGKSAAELKAAFAEFIKRVRPSEATPRWAPGLGDTA